MKDYSKIAMVCHEANRAYCQALGDDSQPSWHDAPDWQRESAIKGVIFKEARPDSTPAGSHDSWLMEKQASGWVWGEAKDPERRTHPCMVAYDELPEAQRAKDFIFQAIAGTMLKFEETDNVHGNDRYDLITAEIMQQQ